jgi:protein-L-isoaspartate O-methyltransferase
LFTAGKSMIAPAIHDAFRCSDKRPWPETGDFKALERSRALAVLIGPGWQEEVQATRDLAQQADQLGGSVMPIVIVLEPGCGLSTHTAEAQLDIGGHIVDMRESSLTAALSRVVSSVPQVCTPFRDTLEFQRDSTKAATIESYDALAPRFTDVWDAHPPFEALEKLLALIPAKSIILDAGCGPGHHTRYLARRGHDVTGIDLSEGMLSIARSKFFPSRFVRMDIENLQQIAMFDAIWCAAAAMHVPRENMPALLLKFRRALRPGGVLGLNLQVGRTSEVACFGVDQRFFEYYHDAREIGTMLVRAGFEVLDADYGETERNTHSAPLTLRWQTLFARPSF